MYTLDHITRFLDSRIDVPSEEREKIIDLAQKNMSEKGMLDLEQIKKVLTPERSVELFDWFLKHGNEELGGEGWFVHFPKL